MPIGRTVQKIAKSASTKKAIAGVAGTGGALKAMADANKKKKQAMGAEGPKKSTPVKMSDDVNRRKKKAYDQLAAIDKGMRRGLGMK